MQIIEITRTLILSFIFLHQVSADTTMRVEGFVLLLWAELLPVLQMAKKKKKKKKKKDAKQSPKCFCQLFSFWLFCH